METSFNLECIFAQCSDILAFDLEDIDNELYPYQEHAFVDAGNY